MDGKLFQLGEHEQETLTNPDMKQEDEGDESSADVKLAVSMIKAALSLLDKD